MLPPSLGEGAWTMVVRKKGRSPPSSPEQQPRPKSPRDSEAASEHEGSDDGMDTTSSDHDHLKLPGKVYLQPGFAGARWSDEMMEYWKLELERASVPCEGEAWVGFRRDALAGRLQWLPKSAGFSEWLMSRDEERERQGPTPARAATRAPPIRGGMQEYTRALPPL